MHIFMSAINADIEVPVLWGKVAEGTCAVRLSDLQSMAE